MGKGPAHVTGIMSLQADLTAPKTDASFSCRTQTAKRHGSQQPTLAPEFLVTAAQMFIFWFLMRGKNGKLKMLILVINPALKLYTIKTKILIALKNDKTLSFNEKLTVFKLVNSFFNCEEGKSIHMQKCRNISPLNISMGQSSISI